MIIYQYPTQCFGHIWTHGVFYTYILNPHVFFILHRWNHSNVEKSHEIPWVSTKLLIKTKKLFLFFARRSINFILKIKVRPPLKSATGIKYVKGELLEAVIAFFNKEFTDRASKENISSMNSFHIIHGPNQFNLFFKFHHLLTFYYFFIYIWKERKSLGPPPPTKKNPQQNKRKKPRGHNAYQSNNNHNSD